MIEAKIIQDSINVSSGKRLTSFVLVLPRIILSELNTHRVFSRNSASSRAVPFNKMKQRCLDNPFVPIKFLKHHKGMQGNAFLEGEEEEMARKLWLEGRDAAVAAADNLHNTGGVTKQLANRMLEPYMWHTVILSGTDFENFFALRAHEDAEIHICKLADEMLKAYNNSTPKKLGLGQWHIPFGDNMDEAKLRESAVKLYGENYKIDLVNLKLKVATARCARVSYFNFEGKDDYISDFKLCDRLFGSIPRHLSPAEHSAQAKNDKKYYGNFQGFLQYRKMFEDENLKDGRVSKC